MSYDIYGNQLSRGHCEVHPYVHEEYPCSVCDMEHRRHQEERHRHNEMLQAQEAEYHKQCIEDHAYSEIGLPIS